ncbi:MAG TPA: zf-HC2 domain-containing protein [Verrucomicrobiae bacterium]|nr:zf-HC2 domain-containing protein [Verrucomicrobiae bacterium]
MQSQDANPRSAGAVNHPGAEEWMAYLYNELAPERKRELHAHLAQCGDCGKQLHQWRAGMLALDEWKTPAPRLKVFAQPPVTLVKWAAAAVVVLVAGFAVGRQSSNAAREVAELKNSVTQLTERMNEERAATSAMREQSLRLLSEYARLDEAHRTEDREAVELALRDIDSRLFKLRSELETVAVNTETGFRQTKEGLTTLASYTVAERGDAPDLPKNEK